MEQYLAKRPQLKESTKNNHNRRYSQILEYLNTIENIENITTDLLSDEKYINLIKTFIETKNLPSRSAYVNTILFIVSPVKAQPEIHLIGTYNIWKKYFYEIDTLYRGNQIKQIKTEKQKKKWVDWEIILKLRNKLKKEFNKKKINGQLKFKYKKTEENLSERVKILELIQNNFFKYQYYLMLCLHTYIYPVRTEYSEMMICSWKYYKHLSNEEKNINHYLINDKRKTKTIIFGKDARKNKMKQSLNVDVPKELSLIINNFIDMRNILFKFTTKDNDTIPLFYKHSRLKNGEDLTYGMTPNLYSKNFINFMDRNLTKKVGVSLMRNIFTSYYRRGERPLEEKKRICEIMNHDPHTQELVYLKQD